MLHCFDISNKLPKNYISNCFICWKQVHQPVYQDHVKISNREREKSENILILWGKTGKYPDFGEKTGKYPDFVEKTGNYPDFN